MFPHPVEHLAEFLATSALIAIAAATGTVFAPRAGLGSAIIDAALARRPFARRLLSVAGLGIVVGVVVAVAIVALDVFVFAPLVPEVLSVGARPLWTGALWALYGGLSEEIVFRYGAMSFLVWLLMKVVRGSAAFCAAAAAASLLFGLTHLRATAALIPLTPPAVARTVVLVALAGVVFGWLYWRRGIEAAIAAHGATALIAHLAVPALGF